MDTFSLDITVDPLPDNWRDLSIGLQSGRDKSEVLYGMPTETALRFDVEIHLKESGDTLDFGGPLVHGKKGDRFLYLSWGRKTAESEHEMFGRLKLYLSPVERKSWSTPGITRDIIRYDTVTTTVSGRGADGCPRCGAAPLIAAT